MREASGYRNKIFHGQVTDGNLKRRDFEQLVSDMRSWCETLADSATLAVGYDGFGRNSFRKGPSPDLWQQYKEPLADLASYEAFIGRHMERGAARQ